MTAIDLKSTFPERMNMLIERAGGTTELARKSRLSRRVIDKYKGGESEPSRERLIALAIAGGVSISWLVTGEEENANNVEEFISIPRYDARVGAGNGAFNDRARLIDYIPFTKDFLAKRLGRTSTAGLVMIEARGDSMEPTIGDGDLVLIDQAETEIGDGVMAYVLDDTAYVKRVRWLLDGIEIISDNRDVYEPIFVARNRMDAFKVIGRVRWIGRVVGR